MQFEYSILTITPEYLTLINTLLYIPTLHIIFTYIYNIYIIESFTKIGAKKRTLVAEKYKNDEVFVFIYVLF